MNCLKMSSNRTINQTHHTVGNGFTPDLLTPIQFCEVIQGGHQQNISVLSSHGVVSSSAVTPITTLVSTVQPQHQTQHHQMAQQQLALHPHKPLQAFAHGTSLLSSSPLTHHAPNSSTTLHHHPHHLHHQLQLQQLHHQQLHQQQVQQPTIHSMHQHNPHQTTAAHHLHQQHIYHQQQLQQQQHQIQLHQQHLQQQQMNVVESNNQQLPVLTQSKRKKTNHKAKKSQIKTNPKTISTNSPKPSKSNVKSKSKGSANQQEVESSKFESNINIPSKQNVPTNIETSEDTKQQTRENIQNSMKSNNNENNKSSQQISPKCDRDENQSLPCKNPANTDKNVPPIQNSNMYQSQNIVECSNDCKVLMTEQISSENIISNSSYDKAMKNHINTNSTSQLMQLGNGKTNVSQSMMNPCNGDTVELPPLHNLPYPSIQQPAILPQPNCTNIESDLEVVKSSSQSTTLTLLSPILTGNSCSSSNVAVLSNGSALHLKSNISISNSNPYPTVVTKVPFIVTSNSENGTQDSECSKNVSTVCTQSVKQENLSTRSLVRPQMKSVCIGTDSAPEEMILSPCSVMTVSTNTSPPQSPARSPDTSSFIDKISSAEEDPNCKASPNLAVYTVREETINYSNDVHTVIFISPTNSNKSTEIAKMQNDAKEDDVKVIAITTTKESTKNVNPVSVIPVKKTWRRPWKKKKDREKKKKPSKKSKRTKPRRKTVYRTQVLQVDARNGPAIDTERTIVSRPSEENIDSLKQKRQRIKLNRNSGREYVNRLGKVVQARKIGKPCICPMKCWDRMGSKVVGIFNNFWDLSDFNLQNSYLFTCLKLCDVKRRYTKKPATESRRQNTFEYFVRIGGKHVRVCKRAFMSSHGLTSDKRLRTLLSQMKDGALLPLYDRRGKHARADQVEEVSTSTSSKGNSKRARVMANRGLSKKRSSSFKNVSSASNEHLNSLAPKTMFSSPHQMVPLHSHCHPHSASSSTLHAHPQQEPPNSYIPNGELYFPGHFLEQSQNMTHLNINQISPCQKMLEAPAYFMAGMKENTFHQ